MNGKNDIFPKMVYMNNAVRHFLLDPLPDFYSGRGESNYPRTVQRHSQSVPKLALGHRPKQGGECPEKLTSTKQPHK